MRTETLPEWKKLKPSGRPIKGVLNRYKYNPVIILTPRSGLFKCPKCIGGVVKEEVDDFQLVLRCVNCGWEKCSMEPEIKHYREVRGNYDTKRY